MFTRSRTGNSYRTSSEIYVGGPHGLGPRDPRGQLVDLSDRPLSCISSNLRNEIVVGGTDHALYSINISSSSIHPVVMYPKDSGHQDWVTTVAHLPNGIVLSGAMDGKVCAWSPSNRRNCIEMYPSQPQKPIDNGPSNSESNKIAASYASLATPSSSVVSSSCSSRKFYSVGGASVEAYPISKILSDTRYNTAVSLTYGGMVDVWKFDDDNNIIQKNSSPIPTSSTSSLLRQNISSFHSMVGSNSSILEGQYIKNNLIIGDKGGNLTLLDIGIMKPRSRFRAHPGAITSITFLDLEGDIFATGSNDGYLKVWDPRLSGSGLAFKIPAHISSGPSVTRGNPQSSVSRNSSTSSSLVRKTNISRAPANSSTNLRGGASSEVKGAPVSIINPFLSNSSGNSSMFNYVITCGGNNHDSRVLVHDLRMVSESNPNATVFYSSSHHSNGIYSSCIVGNDLFFIGDGNGMVMAHRFNSSNDQSNNLYSHYLISKAEEKEDRYRNNRGNSSGGELLYGLGSSSKGAVRGIECINGKLITANEDGNVLIFDY